MNNTDKIFRRARQEDRKTLLESEAKAICMAYNIPVTTFAVAKDEDQAAKFAESIGFPVVLKIVSQDIVHKSDAGGVLLNLKTAESVRSGYNKILENALKFKENARIVGVLVQEMAPQATEVIIGSIKDPQFGQTLMFGLGGIFVELLKDVTFRIAPISEQEARCMIEEVKASPLLNGYRGSPPADKDAIVDALLAVSKLVMDHPEIKELDLNPVMTYETGIKTVDARIILE